MAQAVEEWYKQIPIITRSYLTVAIFTTIGCSLDIWAYCFTYSFSPDTASFSKRIHSVGGICLELAEPIHSHELFGPFHFHSCLFTMDVLLGLSILVGENAWVDLLGMIAGHSYYFLEDVYPRMTGR
ncbi:hypothetical protein OROHE_022068 [Orobanche hederae]